MGINRSEECRKGFGHCETQQQKVSAALYSHYAYRRTLQSHSEQETKSTLHNGTGTSDPRLARSNGSHQLRTDQTTKSAGGVILRHFYFPHN